MPLVAYLVQSGDTLGSLAERFGVSPEALAEANHLAGLGLLTQGQPLVIPDLPSGLAAGAFPADGWIPREAWLTEGEGGDGEVGERPRAVMVERMWTIRLPFPQLVAGMADHVLLALHAGPLHPRAGLTVTLRLIALNAGPVPLILRYPTAQRAEFVVTHDGEEVFRASAGRLYAQQLREVVLGPGNSEVAVERFIPTKPGVYQVTAWNLALRPAQLTMNLEVR